MLKVWWDLWAWIGLGLLQIYLSFLLIFFKSVNIWQSDWQENWLPVRPGNWPAERCTHPRSGIWKARTVVTASHYHNRPQLHVSVSDWQASSCYNYYPIDHFLLAERRHLLLTERRSHAFSRQVSSWLLRVHTVGHSVAFSTWPL